jgi:hypothetical protein
MAMAFLRFLRRLLTLALAAGTGLALLSVYLLPRVGPQDLPWTPLDLDAPIGLATAHKLAALDDDAPRCFALLDRAGVAWRRLPGTRHGACGYDDGVAWAAGGTRRARYDPAAPPLACPLAAALAVWEREVVQPAAQQRLGLRVARIETFGSYACRRLYGRATGDWSEHARARAIDIAGFVLADGRRITIAHDWKGAGPEAQFLHDIRDGACRLFATTLSPDYNPAHRDHLHLDEAARGTMWRACR